MASFYDFERVYGPDTLKIITAAFDNAHECLPATYQKNDRARRRLALIILRHIDRGEHDLVRSLIRPCSISCNNPVRP